MKTQFSIIVVSLLFFCSLTDAQWVQTSLTSSRVNNILVSNNNLFAGTHSNGIYISTDNGLNWSAVNNGLTTSRVQALAVSGTNLFAGTYGGGVFRSTDNGASWNTSNNGVTNPYVLAFAVSDTNIFAATEAASVFRSTNNGSNWSLANNGIPSINIFSLAVSGTNLFAGTNGGGVYISTNNGLNWSTVNNGLTNTFILSLAVSGTNLFAGTYGGGVFRSTDNGSNWTAANNGGLTGAIIRSFAVVGTNLFAGASSGVGVFHSTDNGLSWNSISTGLPVTNFLSLAVKGDNLFAATESIGLWKRSLDGIIPVELVSFTANINGNIINLNWSTSTETNNSGFDIERRQILNTQPAVSNEEWETISFITGHGTTTETHSYSFIDKNLISGKYIYRLKQIDLDGTFEYSNEVEVTIMVPEKFELSQNYPNPFNPSTKIRYSIPNVGSGLAQTVLKVYDVLGNEVATLVNEEKPAGNYEVDFNASQLSSGIYFYKLQAGSFVETRKMTLLR